MFNYGETLESSEVIATREFVIPGTIPPRKLVIKLGIPRKRLDCDDYECGCEIDEFGRTYVWRPRGSDAFQALMLALILLGTDIVHINGMLGGALTWAGGEPGKLGLPIHPDYSLGPAVGWRKL